MGLRTVACILLVSAVSMGCGNMVLRWQTISWPPLSNHGCPDLSGQYSGELYDYITAIVDLAWSRPGRISNTGYARQTIADPYWRRAASDASSTTIIRYSPQGIVIVLQTAAGNEAARTEIRLDTPMTGCRDGALVLRTERRTAGVEGSAATLEWSEYEIRRHPDGSLETMGRGAMQTYSGLMGMAGGTKWYLPTDPIRGTRGKTFAPR